MWGRGAERLDRAISGVYGDVVWCVRRKSLGEWPPMVDAMPQFSDVVRDGVNWSACGVGRYDERSQTQSLGVNVVLKDGGTDTSE